VRKITFKIFVLVNGLLLSVIIPVYSQLQPDTTSADTTMSLSTPDSTMSDSSVTTFRTVPNNAWDVGEKLSFIVRYGPLVAGDATMEVADTVRYQNRLCYKIRTTANSNKFISKFYKVRDKAESTMDAQGLFSWKFEKNLREGKYKLDKLTEFDQTKHVATSGRKTIDVPPNVQDVLSALYFMRTQNYAVGSVISLQNVANMKLYDLKIKIHRKDRVRVRAGTFDCVVVEPFLIEGGGIFKHEGKILIWVTDDERHMPVQMKSKVFIGAVTAELVKIEGVD